MNKLKTLGVLALLNSSLIFSNAQAEGLLKSGPSVFNYDYVDLEYIDNDGADGFGLRFSADFKENLAVQVGYSKLSAGRLDFDTLSGGVAYHIQTSNYPQADWVFDAGLQTADSGFNDDTGLYLGAGIRYAVNDALEVNGSVNLNTIGDTDLNINLRALYEVATGFSALLETNIADDSAIGLGLRFYWR